MAPVRSRRVSRRGAVAASLLVALALVRPVAAANVQIGFEDMPAPPVQGTAAGSPVADFYGARGVEFANAFAYTYNNPGANPWVDGAVGVEGCGFGDDCFSQIEMQFPIALNSLSLMYGIRRGLPGEALILQTFDANGQDAGTTAVDLPVDQLAGLQPLTVKGIAPIASAMLVIKGETLAGLVFDDFVLEQVSLPQPALAIGLVDKVVGTDAITFTIPVVNGGDAASNPSKLRVKAVGNKAWKVQNVDLDAVPAHGQQTIRVDMPIPDSAKPGSSQDFEVFADPKGIAGDPDTANNSLLVNVSLPEAAISVAPRSNEAVVTAAPTSPPTPAPSEPVGPVASSSDPAVPFLGGLFVGALGAGGALVLTYSRKISQLNVQLKGTLNSLDNLEFELKASDADPPETCDRSGSIYCKREVNFIPKERTISALGVGGVRAGKKVSLPLPQELRDRLLQVARRDDGSPEATAAIDGLATDLAHWCAASIDGLLDNLAMTVRITGSEATGSFTPYMCTIDGGQGHYREIRKWSRKVTDGFDRTIASLPRYDGTDVARDRLATSLRAGIRGLALDL